MEAEGAVQLAGGDSVAEPPMELLQVDAGGNLFEKILADDVLLFQTRKAGSKALWQKHSIEGIELDDAVGKRVQFRLAD